MWKNVASGKEALRDTIVMDDRESTKKTIKQAARGKPQNIVKLL